MEFKFWSVLALAITLVGTVLNARKNIWGFYVWLVANMMWLVITWKMRDASLAIQYLVFTILNIYGIFEWKRKGR